MKKIILPILLLAISANAFAAGPDTSTIEFLTIVLIIWGILEILLFFKIWGMTNDVRKIEGLLNENYSINSLALEAKIRKDIICGDKEHAKKLLLANFFKQVNTKYESEYQVHPTATIEEYVNTLQSQFNQIGEELPDNIKNLKKLSDFSRVFNL